MMIVKVAVAKSDDDVVPTPESFVELNDVIVKENERYEGREGFLRLFWGMAGNVSRPYLMATGKEPKVGHLIWNSESHDLGWAWLDFERGKRIWIRVGLSNSEF